MAAASLGSDLYQHEPLLSERHIRVLDLEISSNPGSPVCFSLRQVPLDQPKALDYEALSYVWGSRTPNVPIYCDGKVLLVTQNCYDVLIRLRRRKRLSRRKRRILWIDAICIDQSVQGIPERNSQVKLMGEVYEKAKRVLIWLGNGDENTAAFFDFMFDALRFNALVNVEYKLGRMGRAAAALAWPLGEMLWKIQGHSKESPFNTSKWTASTKAAARQLFQNPWFQRVWTVQEFAFAKVVIILWGDQELTWDKLLSIVSLCEKFDPISQPETRAFFESVGHRNNLNKVISALVDRHGASITPGLLEEHDLSTLLYMRQLQATVPHDKVYGLYSIFTTLNIKLPAPDYAIDPATAFEDITIAWIQSRQKLDILCFSTGAKTDLPSWVPDWTEEHRLIWMPGYHLNIDQSGLGVVLRSEGSNKALLYKPYSHASRSLKPSDIRPNRCRGTLPLRGKDLGRVAVAICWEDRPDDLGDCRWDLFPSLRQTAKRWCQAVNELSVCADGTDAQSAFGILLWRAGHGTKTSLCPDDFELGFSEMLTMDPESEASADTDPDTTNIPTYAISRLAAYTFLVIHGGYIGFGHRSCAVGDLVYLLAGSPWPVVLRPVSLAGWDHHYHFVAPVHIQGVMDGEAWSENESLLEDITLI